MSRGGAIDLYSLETGASRVVYTPTPNSLDPKVDEVLVSDDARTLYFRARAEIDGRAQIWAVPVAGGSPRLLVDFRERISTRPEFGAGQGYFYFTFDERRSNIWVADVTER